MGSRILKGRTIRLLVGVLFLEVEGLVGDSEGLIDSDGGGLLVD